MAKRGKAAKPATKPREKKSKTDTVGHVVIAMGRAGNRPEPPMTVAPEPQPLDLGPLQIPEGEEAEKALRQLGMLNDRVLAAFKAHEDAKATAKARKEKWDELSEELQKKIRLFTHKSDLPLFDADVREKDQTRMELAARMPEEQPLVAPEATTARNHSQGRKRCQMRPARR